MKKNKFLTRFLTSILVGGVLVGTVFSSSLLSASAMNVPDQGYSNVIQGDDDDDEWVDVVFSYDNYSIRNGTYLTSVSYPIHVGLSRVDDSVALTDYINTPKSYWSIPDDEGFYPGGYSLDPDYYIFDSATYALLGLNFDNDSNLPDGLVYPIYSNQSYSFTGFVSSCYKYQTDEDLPIVLDPWEIMDYYFTDNMTIDDGFTFVGTYRKNISHYFSRADTYQYTYYRFYALHFSGLNGYLTFFVPYGNQLFNSSDLTPTSIPVIPLGTYQDGFNDGRAEGFADGYADGYSEGYILGDTEGYFRGYDEGLLDGADEVVVVDNLNYTRTIAENVNNLLSIAIFPGITFRTLLMMSFGLVLAFAIFKFIF